MEQEALGHGVLEAAEKVAMQEGQFDRVPDRLHGLLLPADGGPRKFADRLQRAFGAASGPENLEGDPLVGVEADFEAGLLGLPLREQGGAEDDQRRQAGLRAQPEAPVGEDFVEADDGARGVEAELLDDGEGFIAEDALPALERGEPQLGVDPADVVGAAEADVGAVLADGSEEGADAERRGTELSKGFVVFLSGRLPGLVLGFLEGW